MGLPFNYTDFTGGFNSYNAYDDLADNEARDVVNVQGSTAGAIVKRGGFQHWWTPTNVLNSINGAISGALLIGADDVTGNLVSFNGATQSTVKTGLTAGKRWEFVRAPIIGIQGAVYGLNGTDTPQQWPATGSSSAWTATDAGGVVPNGTYLLYHQNQVFIAGTPAKPSRLYWSGLGDPTAWNPANLNGSGFLDFDPDDGLSITGIGTVGPYVLVFKAHKTWVLVDPATATTRKVSDQVGCQSHRSIASGVDGTFFLGGDSQVYLTNGSKITRISDKIAPTLATLETPLSSCYFDSHYYLSGTTDAAAPLTLDYDVRLGSWWKHPVAVNDFAPTWQAEAQENPFAALASTAVVSRAFVSGVHQDNGANFAWSWSGPWQSPTFYRRRRFPTPFFRKRHRQTRYDGLGQVDFSMCKDFNTTPTLVASDIFANSLITKEARSYGQGVANAFSIVFSGTYPTPAQVNQYTLLISDRKDSMGSGY